MKNALRSVALLAGAFLLPPRAAGAQTPWIAVVVPAGDAVETVNERTVSLIFRRKALYAADGSRVQPVNLPADNPLRRRFSQALLGTSPEGMEDYWNQQYFQGLMPPHVLASEAAVDRFVDATAHAIGYLSACAVGARLRIVLVIDPDQRVLPPTAMPACDAASP